MTPHLLLALDPGLPDAGIALYRDAVLVLAVWVRVPPAPDNALTTVVLLDAIDRQIEAVVPEGQMPQTVIAEWPQILPRRGERVNPAGLLDVAGVAAAFLDRAASWGAAISRYTPKQWKGTWPKGEHQRHGLALLSADERALLPKMPRAGRYESDPLDAALLGLWHLHKTHRRQPKFYNRPAEFVGLVE